MYSHWNIKNWSSVRPCAHVNMFHFNCTLFWFFAVCWLWSRDLILLLRKPRGKTFLFKGLPLHKDICYRTRHPLRRSSTARIPASLVVSLITQSRAMATKRFLPAGITDSCTFYSKGWHFTRLLLPSISRKSSFCKVFSFDMTRILICWKHGVVHFFTL